MTPGRRAELREFVKDPHNVSYETSKDFVECLNEIDRLNQRAEGLARELANVKADLAVSKMSVAIWKKEADLPEAGAIEALSWILKNCLIEPLAYVDDYGEFIRQIEKAKALSQLQERTND